MKPKRSIINILITLVVLTAAAVPASHIYKNSVLNAEAVQSAAVPLPVPSTGDIALNFAAELIPYQAKPWLEPAARQGFRADTIPYQAKHWLKPPASSPLISPQQRVQQYWQFEASRWQAIGDSYAKVTSPADCFGKVRL
jgi:hypothetical protein